VNEPISTDLKAVMRRLRLGKLLDTLPERLALARRQKVPHHDFLFTLLSDECQRRDSAASTLRAQRALLDPHMVLERWDRTAKVTYDQSLLAELVSLRFVEAHRHATIVGPVGVGKTFLAHALGHIACRRGYTVLALRADRLLKTLSTHGWITPTNPSCASSSPSTSLSSTTSVSTPWIPPRAATYTKSSPSGIARRRSPSLRTAVPMSGSAPSPTRSAPKPPLSCDGRDPGRECS
jgi:hypothetical protein